MMYDGLRSLSLSDVKDRLGGLSYIFETQCFASVRFLLAVEEIFL